MSSVRNQIIEFLSNNENRSFTSSEICSNIKNNVKGKTPNNSICSRISTLYKNNIIDRKKINKKYVYLKKKDNNNEEGETNIIQLIENDIIEIEYNK